MGKISKGSVQKAWEETWPDAAAMEREVKRLWGLSYLEFMGLMYGKMRERNHAIRLRRVLLILQIAILACQLLLTKWLCLR